MLAQTNITSLLPNSVVLPSYIDYISGAGPAGLATAKSLLRDHPAGSFQPVIFEKRDHLGGLWPLSKAEDNGLVNPDMCINQSRHTVSFSGFAWDAETPMFPKAWQVGQYLNDYAKMFELSSVLRTGCTVKKATRHMGLGHPQWKVDIITNNGTSESHSFDHLVIASGFFGRPHIPQLAGYSGPLTHSVQFRDVEQLVNSESSLKDLNSANSSSTDAIPDTFGHMSSDSSDPVAKVQKGGAIVVVGGQMSGAEVAAAVATQLSSILHSPGTPTMKHAEAFNVHHIITRPFWIMPLHFPTVPEPGNGKDKNSASTFLPVDLVMYNLAKRSPAPFADQSGIISLDGAVAINSFVRSYIGTTQCELVDEKLAIEGDIESDAPWLVVSDNYSELVRCGAIKVQTGRVKQEEQFTAQGSGRSLTLVKDDVETKLDNVVAVIIANGFDASSSLDFLDEDVLQILQHDPKCKPFPVILNCHSSTHHQIPDIGFVGFYRSPYWGVMEMQARFLGRLWAGDAQASAFLDKDDGLAHISRLRECFYETPERLAQFPMGDYTYLMESFATTLGIKRSGFGEPGSSGNWTGPVLPARYAFDGLGIDEDAEVQEAIDQAKSDLRRSQEEALFVPRATFRGLQGKWLLSRNITSASPSYPSGRFEGTAWFHPRAPTDAEFDLEYLYVEEGHFTTEQGFSFPTNRRLVSHQLPSHSYPRLFFTNRFQLRRDDTLSFAKSCPHTDMFTAIKRPLTTSLSGLSSQQITKPLTTSSMR